MTGTAKENASPADMEEVRAKPIVEENKEIRKERSKDNSGQKREDAEKTSRRNAARGRAFNAPEA